MKSVKVTPQTRQPGSTMPNHLLESTRAVIFDVGNTLAFPDWKRINEITKRAAACSYDPTLLHDRMCAIVRRLDSDPAMLRDLAERRLARGWAYRLLYGGLGLDEAQIEALVAALIAEQSERHLWNDLNRDAVPVIRELKKLGLIVAAISNTDDGQIERLLRALEVADYLDLIVDSHVVGLTKPDPRIFLHTIERLGVAPDEAVYIGDSYTQDVVGARRAGLRAILFDPFDMHTELEAVRIRSLRELISA